MAFINVFSKTLAKAFRKHFLAFKEFSCQGLLFCRRRTLITVKMNTTTSRRGKLSAAQSVPRMFELSIEFHWPIQLTIVDR